MKNTLENKARFFAQYHSQEVAYIPSYMQGDSLIKAKVDRIHEVQYLELTSLQDIIDEDAIEVLDEHDKKQFNDNNFKIVSNETGWHPVNYDVDLWHWTAEQTDYLRSKGYALPWMGLSVEHQIEYGWIQLKSTVKTIER